MGLDRNGGLLPVDVRFNSSRRAWWLGSCGHSWDMSVSARAVGGCGCPYCSDHRVLAGFNDLASQRPDIAAQWDHGRNGGVRPDGVVAGSTFKAWWACDSGHSWRMSVYNRTAGTDRGCPYCGGRKALAGFNDLSTTHPHLAAQWDYGVNGGLRPEDMLAGSCKRVGWRCEMGHTWPALVVNRAKGKNGDPGCPYCKGRKVLAGFNDLATTHPEVAAMWHPRMNKRLSPADVMATSGRKVWWLGPCRHVYQMPVRNRVQAKSSYCPYCSGRKKPERPIKL